MLVKFKQAVRLPPGPKGKDYSRGVHDVPEEGVQNPYFHKLIQAGLVEDGEAAKVVSPLSLQVRQQKLVAKIQSKSSPVASAPVNNASGIGDAFKHLGGEFLDKLKELLEEVAIEKIKEGLEALVNKIEGKKPVAPAPSAPAVPVVSPSVSSDKPGEEVSSAAHESSDDGVIAPSSEEAPKAASKLKGSSSKKKAQA